MTDKEWPQGRAFPDPLPWRALRRRRRIKGVSLVILNAVNILIISNQILRKRSSEWQLLFLVGWLSRGIGWYGFHNDDPACDCLFRYFLNILSLGSCFQGTKMRNSGLIYNQFRLLRPSQWQKPPGDLGSDRVCGEVLLRFTSGIINTGIIISFGRTKALPYGWGLLHPPIKVQPLGNKKTRKFRVGAKHTNRFDVPYLTLWLMLLRPMFGFESIGAFYC